MATPSQLPTPKSTDLAIDPSWQKGDFEIVTSDKVVLCVNSLSLRCWSDVFQDMLIVGSGEKRIELEETSTIVRQFLHLTEKLCLNVQWAEENLFGNMLPLVTFLNKFDCEIALRMVLSKIEERVESGAWPRLLLFLIRAKLGIPALCTRDPWSSSYCVPHIVYDRRWWEFPENCRPPLSASGPLLFTLDFDALKPEFADAIPHAYRQLLDVDRTSFFLRLRNYLRDDGEQDCSGEMQQLKRKR